jgi:hypothetical protein
LPKTARGGADVGRGDGVGFVVGAGDLRGAIRKAYIAVLCELGDRKVIRLAQHKTNRDYLAGVRDRAELYGALRPLTHSFERHWYGFAPATPSDWDEYRALCNQAISS